jgi:tRNA(Ile)-lysidine synthase
MTNSFIAYIEKIKLFNHNQKILLTVSGGIDSMVMLDLFMKSGFQAGIAHCNFGLRGDESDADEMFVSESAKIYRCPLYVKNMDAKSFAEKQKLSLQMAARELRYAWFEELIDETDFDLYATAHQFDDQIETFFINLLRGTGIAGLTGITPKNGNCIRPLLFAERNKIVQYAKENGIKYREDSSNAKHDYLRNRIRHIVLPAIEKAKPSYKSGFQKTFKALELTSEFLQDKIEKPKSEILNQKDDMIYVEMEKLKQEPQPEFLLFEMLKVFGFNFSTIAGAYKSFGKSSGKRFLSKTHELFVDRKFLIVKEIQAHSKDEGEIEPGQDEIKTPIHLKLSDFMYTNQKIPTSSSVAWLDYDKIKFPLIIRNFEEGDYFVPLGMKGRKKLSDFFIDQKIPVPEKHNIKVLISGNEIAWIVGHRIDNRFKISSETQRVFSVEII